MITEVQERLMSGHLSTSEVNGSVLYHQVVNVPVIGEIVQCPVSPGLLTFVLQGPISNSGPVYIGGSTVGRTGTATVGLSIRPGVTYGPVRLSNTRALYVTADNANDKLVIFGVA